jgi:hypothetical protein
MDDFGWSGMGIQVQDVMQQAGFCAMGHGKFSWQAGKISLLGQYPCNQPIKEQYHCFLTTTIDLDTSNG